MKNENVRVYYNRSGKKSFYVEYCFYNKHCDDWSQTDPDTKLLVKFTMNFVNNDLLFLTLYTIFPGNGSEVRITMKQTF